ncbi:MAG: DNA-processing protein DprA [Clostridia bacterium]|nr:DNA-processing protein DprA [Clostridia bacterium]
MARSLYWIWLSLRMGEGKSGVAELLEHFGSPQNIYDADAHELGDYFGHARRSLCESLSDKNLDEAYQIESYCVKNGISILHYSEKGYPKLLTNLKNPPIILYARGKIADLDERVSIGVVGTRSISEYGRQSAYRIGYELAAAGAVVVSGLALGNDSVAACGALDARGRTVAVLGSGLDRIYPAAHKKLAREVARHGLLLSEYPPLTPPSRSSFPMRNRIISGLSQGTLVIEAGKGSGALITARDAILQGRDVYALPGNVTAETAFGTNELIKDGASAVTCAADILENYQYIYGNKLDMNVLGKLRGRSALKRGALAAHGVDEGALTMPEDASADAEGTIGALLHARGHVDGETVKRMSGETEYPVYRDDKRKEKITPAAPNEKKAAPEGPSAPASGSIPADLDAGLADVLRAMPQGEAVGVDRICEGGLDPVAVMTAMTMLEIRGLVESRPGNRYLRK